MKMSKGSTHKVWRRCNECGYVWFGMTTSKSHWLMDEDGSNVRSEMRSADGKRKRIYCGSGRLIRYPEQDAEVQLILKVMNDE